MELIKRDVNTNLAELTEHFTADEIKKNLYFLMILNTIFINNVEPVYSNVIQVIDPQNEDNITFYTQDKFLEVYDTYGLDGFIYNFEGLTFD